MSAPNHPKGNGGGGGKGSKKSTGPRSKPTAAAASKSEERKQFQTHLGRALPVGRWLRVKYEKSIQSAEL